MGSYIVKVECTYEFKVEITGADTKAEAIRLATTEALEDLTIEDMKFKKAKARDVVYQKDDEDYD